MKDCSSRCRASAPDAPCCKMPEWSPFPVCMQIELLLAADVSAADFLTALLQKFVTVVCACTCKVVRLPCCDGSSSSLVFGARSTCGTPSELSTGNSSGKIVVADSLAKHTLKASHETSASLRRNGWMNLLDFRNLILARKARGMRSRGIS